MIVENSIENRRVIIGLIAKGELDKRQLKQLQYDEDLNYLNECVFDPVNVYLCEFKKMTDAQLDEFIKISEEK